MVDIETVKQVVSEASASVRAGYLPNVSILVSNTGEKYLIKAPETLEELTYHSLAEISQRLATDKNFSRAGSVLYSYGKPVVRDSDMFLFSKSVYIVDDEEFTSRGLKVGREPYEAVLESESFPMHPSLNALEPLKLWDETR